MQSRIRPANDPHTRLPHAPPRHRSLRLSIRHRPIRKTIITPVTFARSPLPRKIRPAPADSPPHGFLRVCDRQQSPPQRRLVERE